MKIETDKMAVLQAMRNCLNEIPFLQLMNTSVVKEGPGLDLLVDIRVRNQPLTLLAEYKSSGQPRLAPAVRYQCALAYVDGDLDSLTDSLGWKQVSSGPNVSLLVPYDEGVFFDRRQIDGTTIVTPVQIYLDLQSQRGRGQEAPEAIRKVIEQTW
jgi:hypothetical protein